MNTYRREPLSAILPGAALYELWALIGTAEKALLIVSVMVVVTAILGMITMILATLNERRREMALRGALGAGRGRLVRQFLAEGAVLALAASLLALVLARWALDGLLAAEALQTGRGIIELVREKGLLDEETLAAVLNPDAMTGNGG